MNYTFYLLEKLIALFCIILSCSVNAQVGFKQSGMASFYGEKFQGKKTACGEVFDKEDYTAAHKKLPYNAVLKVTNLKNNKIVYVRVNDRGPYSNSRIIDLSQAAARKIDLLNRGVGKVNIEVVSLDGIVPNIEVDTLCIRTVADANSTDYTKLKPGRIYSIDGIDTTLNGYGIQILSVTNPANVKAPTKIGYRKLAIPIFVEVTEINSTPLYRLIAGNFKDRLSAQQQITKFKKMGYDCFIKKHINTIQ